MDRVEDKEKLQDTRLDCQEREIRELREQVTKMGEMGGPSIVREMDERGLKENNLIFHRVLEARGGDAKFRIDHDKKVIQQLLNVMEVTIGVEKDTKFVRRLGLQISDTEGEGGSDPRPLPVGLRHRYHCELVLENCWKLGEADNLALRTGSVVKDLTVRQRAGERELHKEAARRNLSRSQENMDGNLAFKIVGRRGCKREILAPLREGEHINAEGEVVWSRDTDGGVAGGRGTARRGRRTGPAVASYPNCLEVGRPGGTGMGPSQGTAQDQMGLGALRGRGGGWGRGGGMSTSSPGGSRDHRQEGGGSGWTTAGRGGSCRPRDVSRSPPERRGPPEKKVDNRASPKSATIGNSPLLIELSPNRFAMPGGEGDEDDEEVENDAVEMF